MRTQIPHFLIISQLVTDLSAAVLGDSCRYLKVSGRRPAIVAAGLAALPSLNINANIQRRPRAKLFIGALGPVLLIAVLWYSQGKPDACNDGCYLGGLKQ